MRRKNSGIAASTLLITLFSTVTAADELEYEFRAGVGHSDNIARTEANEIDETVGVAGLELDYQYDSRGIELDILADLEYRYYADETFDNDSFGSVNTDVLLNLTRNILTWGVEHRFGHVITDPFAAENPRTRERINTLATGPNVNIPLGSATSVGLIGRIGSDNFSETDADNDNLSGNFFLTRALSRNRSISINATANRVEFDNTVINSSFDRQAAFIGFSSENSRGSIDLRLGQNELHDRGTVEDSSFVEATLTRRLTESTGIEVSFNQQLTFASELFQQLQGPGLTFGDTRNIVGVADPLEVTLARVAIDFRRASNDFFVAVSTRDEDFVADNGLDRSISEVRIGGGRRVGAAWQLNFGATLRRIDFDQDPREDDDVTVTVGLRRQITSALGLSLDVSRIDRDSNAVDASFAETTGFLTVRYGR